jgi:hypothetical protein
MVSQALGPDSLCPSVRQWRVIHACEDASQVVSVVEAQSQVGMKPQILAREYWNSVTTEVSLITAWNDVRDWRHALNEAEMLNSIQIVHAHSFASAMAGVRGNIPLVYDFCRTLEEMARESSTTGPWLLRSFRVAEQFALSKAAAVVTHNSAMQEAAIERGALEANVFVVPETPPGMSIDSLGALYDDIYRHANSRRTDNLPRIPLPKLYALGTT